MIERRCRGISVWRSEGAQATPDGMSNEPERGAKRGGAGMVVGLVLAGVLVCGGGSVCAVGLAIGYQYYSGEMAISASAGLLAVVNLRSDEVLILCTSAESQATASGSVVGGGSTRITVPSRPVVCAATLVDGSNVGAWTAEDPPLATETWTWEIAAAPAAIEPVLPSDPPVVVDPAVALDPAAVTASAVVAAPVVAESPSNAGAAPVRRTSSAKSGAVGEPVAPTPMDAASVEPTSAPPVSTKTDVRISTSKGKKLKGAAFAVDGRSISVPTTVQLATGIHTLTVVHEDDVHLECRIVTSGPALSVVINADAPACP